MKTILDNAKLSHMPANAIKAFRELEALGAPVKVWHITDENDSDYRGYFWIDAERYDSSLWADYYDNFWGSDKLNDILEANGLYFEWYNAAYSCVYDLDN